MKTVSKKEYMDYLRKHTEGAKDVPVETVSQTVMQTIDEEANLRAQAIYAKHVEAPVYQIREGDV